FGFGVVFSDRALEFLNEGDPETFAAIVPHLESWTDITVVHRGERIRIDGVGFAAIGRLDLLHLLQARARSVGVEPTFRHPIVDLRELGDADVIVGADGVNSLVRRTHAAAFGATTTYLTNRFAWFGTAQPFETLTQTFRHTNLGNFNAHHYRYAPAMSTFLVEVTEETFTRAGFDRMSATESAAVCAGVFAADLDGHPLLSNNSVWRRFPIVRNARWWHDRHVLIGDALHTAHFSIGSGTRLAMQDAIALDRALSVHAPAVRAQLRAFEPGRRPAAATGVEATNASGAWNEGCAEHMAHEPLDFAMSYLTRSGRIAPERLRQSSPQFAARYERER